MKEESRGQKFEEIKVLQKRHYGCLAKIFCCKCIHCCQDFDFSLLTSERRKNAFQHTVQKYIKTLHEGRRLNLILDPFFILVALLLGEESETYHQLMGVMSSQSQPTIFSKQDLEFYIPELCTYLVFHAELQNIELENLMVRACKVDIHFSLKYYFYMRSLEMVNMTEEVRKYERVSKYNHKFRQMINHYYQEQRKHVEMNPLLHPSFARRQEDQHSIVLEERCNSDGEDRDKQNHIEAVLRKSAIVSPQKKKGEEASISDYDQKTEKTVIDTKEKMKMNKMRFLQQTNIYEPFISEQISYPKGLFQSTVNFFSDLIELSKRLVTSNNRKEELRDYLEEVNHRLPATVYVPFTKQGYQDLNIISVLVDEARVFSTKQRAPFMVCLEAFHNPTYNQGVSKDRKIRSSTHIPRKTKKKTSLFEDDELRESQLSIKHQLEEDIRNSNNSTNSKEDKKKKKGWASYFSLKKIKRKIKQFTDNQNDSEEEQEPSEDLKTEGIKSQMSNELVQPQSQIIEEVFGQSQSQQFQRISNGSPYNNLPGYKLIHVIIKSYDDLRQESFAMQLLQEIDKIFKMQKLPVKLLPYEVLPLTHQSGILECVRDAVTIDELRKKGHSIEEILNTRERMKNFIYTLAGYSLVTYLLQVKDRHNGNIMIRRDGSIFHIDYGFFMSNAPGKGVQLEKKLPFKLTNAYVEALGGVDSKNFNKFRRYFYQAFNACRKHQHRILIVAKLIYTSYGKTMPCFIKGDEAIIRLQERFNPPDATTDAEVSLFCQNLINSSIDNWRSRWYDKWQYYMQGIFY